MRSLVAKPADGTSPPPDAKPRALCVTSNLMRKIISFILLTLPGSTFGQKTDTIFLKREISQNPYPYYHAVFIDTTDKFRKQLTDFSFYGYDSSIYYSSLKKIKQIDNRWFESCVAFPRRWVSAYKLKDVYYLYYPSDFGYHYTFQITDSTVISHDMEGPSAGKGVLLKCNLSRNVELNMTIYSSATNVKIEMLDINRGIALFEFSPQVAGKASYRKLMIDAEKAYKFPTVVNYCKTQKMEEYTFDSIDSIILTE